MKRSFSFAGNFAYQWPSLVEIERVYWRTARGTEPDGFWFKIDGLLGTENMSEPIDRVNAHLYGAIHPQHGVILMHAMWDGRTRTRKTTYNSRGNLSRRLEFWQTTEGDLRSFGLSISPEIAWQAIREFIIGDGARSLDVPWISDEELPTDTFPEPPPPDPSKWTKRLT